MSMNLAYPNLNTEESYATYDLGQTAALVALGFPIKDINKSEPRKVQFFFERGPVLIQAVSDYWDNRLQVPARSMFDALKMLKCRIYSD